MPYMIDGHNLIGKLSGLDLDDLEDEKALIEILQDFCRRENKKVEVYFDKAAPGGSRAKVHGRVTARYVRSDDTADNAIKRHLARLDKDAPNWTVVSSDREVIASAKRAKARTTLSEDFARRLGGGAGASSDIQDDPNLSADEVDEWLDLFGGDD